MAVLLMLGLRTFLFVMLQWLTVVSSGIGWEESVKWWPMYVIAANVICFFFLRHLLQREGTGYLEFVRAGGKGKNFRDFIFFLLVGGFTAVIGLFGVSFLLYGGPPPELLMQSLPVWAAVTTLLLFPLTIALVEIPLYIGYCLPRLQARMESKYAPIGLTVFFLAFQHYVMPVSGDVKFMVWHFVSMIPISLAFTLFFLRTKRLLPLMMVHYLLDLQLAVNIMLVTLR